MPPPRPPSKAVLDQIVVYTLALELGVIDGGGVVDGVTDGDGLIDGGTVGVCGGGDGVGI